MQILGIDYGRRKIGIAIGDTQSGLAEPYKVIMVGSIEDALEKVSKVSEVSRVSSVYTKASADKQVEEVGQVENVKQEVSAYATTCKVT